MANRKAKKRRRARDSRAEHDLLLSESCEEAQRLVAAEACDPLGWLKLAEALSFLGDDEGVLETVGRAERSGVNPEIQGPLEHLAAVAACRLGRRYEAILRWKRALRLVPSLEPARANLRDVKQTVSLRHGPWAFKLARWLPRSARTKLQECIRGLEDLSADKEIIARRSRRFLENHPRIAALLPRLLQHGDAEACDLVVRLAALGATSELYAALLEFGLGQRGSDELRWRALQAVADAGEAPTDQVCVWINGRWTDVLLLDFEIYEEPIQVHSPEVEDWASEAFQRLEDGALGEAERLLKRALAAEPDASDLANNLARAYDLEGRHDEARALVLAIHQRDPDYFFGRANMVHLSLQEGDIERAKQFIEPLLKERRLHVTEFSALSSAQIRLCLAQGQTQGARSWLAMWEKAVPDDPDQERWRKRIARTPSGRRRPMRSSH